MRLSVARRLRPQPITSLSQTTKQIKRKDNPMFDNYKKTLTKQEKKQFAAIQKQLVPLFNDFDNLDTFNAWMDQKIISLKSPQAKKFYQNTKAYINKTITQLQELDKAYDIAIYPDDINNLRPPIKKIFDHPLSPFEELILIENPDDPTSHIYNVISHKPLRDYIDNSNYILQSKTVSQKQKEAYLTAIGLYSGEMSLQTYRQKDHHIICLNPELAIVKDYVTNEIPINNTYFKDLPKGVQDAFLDTTLVSEERFNYRTNGQDSPMPDNLF